MALIRNQGDRYDVPHEPGEWIEIRPLKASDERLIQADYPTPIDRELALLKAIIVGWSYDAPLEPEAVEDIDRDTLHWLDQTVLPPLLARSDEEKKALSSGLSGTPPRRIRRTSPSSSNT